MTRTTTPLSAHACPFEPHSKAINEPTSLTAPTRPPLHITVTELDTRACCVGPSTTTPNFESFELKLPHDPQQKPDDDKSDGGTHLPSWLKDPRQRRAVQRVFRQLVAHYQDHPTCPRPPVPFEDLEHIDDAESFKTALLQHAPTEEHIDISALATTASLWRRISLQRLRFHHQRRHYVVVHTLDRQHRLLVLQVPPRQLTDDELRAHARMQMTYNDDLHGRYTPGLRLKDEFTEHMGPEDELFKDGFLHGFPMNFLELPKPRRMANYHSYEVEHRDKSEADAERQHQAGYLEEVMYYPTVIHGQGGILKENGKYRPVVDCTASGLNANLVPLPCHYDMLDDTLAGVRPGDHLSGFDLKDAFYLWPRLQAHCDYLGIITPSGRVFRYRFTPMGLTDSPAIQGWGAQIFRRAIDAALLRVCERQAVPGAIPSQTLGVFVDDGKNRHDKAYSPEQMVEQYQEGYIDTIERYHLPGTHDIDSVSKQDWPAPSGTHIGVHIDPQSMHVEVTPARRAKYSKAAIDAANAWARCSEVPRRQLASLVGKFEYTAPLVKGMHATLSTLHAALKKPVSGDHRDWSRHSRVTVHPHHLLALRQAAALLDNEANCRRRIYHDSDDGTTGFWQGHVPDTHEAMDESSTTASGILVYTGDADKGAAGLWHKDLRHVQVFPPEHQHPHKSSNFRELSTALFGLQKWGPLFRDQRVLYRTDNITTRAVINKGGTTAPDLLPVANSILATARHYNIDLAAAHIPGHLNGLADRLSRHRRKVDTSDWMFDPELFRQVHHYLKQHWLPRTTTGELGTLTLDGNADVTGSNAHLPRFCSIVDSYFDRDLRGEHLWTNPDFTIIEEVLKYFLAHYKTSPHNTSGTFLLPEWTEKPFWKHTKGARVVARFPRSSALFTSPDWRSITDQHGTLSYAPQRTYRGATRWPCLIVHFPCAVGRRTSGGPLRPGAGMAGDRPALPTLRGRPQEDSVLLRGLRAGLVR